MTLAGTTLDPSDPIRIMRRGAITSYTSNADFAMRTPDELLDEVPPEPESVPKEVEQEFAQRSQAAREVLMADELARQRTASRTNRLKQLEREARQRSRDASRFTDRIDRTLVEFQRWMNT